MKKLIDKIGWGKAALWAGGTVAVVAAEIYLIKTCGWLPTLGFNAAMYPIIRFGREAFLGSHHRTNDMN